MLYRYKNIPWKHLPPRQGISCQHGIVVPDNTSIDKSGLHADLASVLGKPTSPPPRLSRQPSLLQPPPPSPSPPRLHAPLLPTRRPSCRRPGHAEHPPLSTMDQPPQTEQRKRKHRRGGRRRRRRQSFLAPDEAGRAPSSAAAETPSSFYRLGQASGDRSTTSLDSQALLDHR